MMCSGVLCFVFLLFQRDVRELMFSRFGPLTIAADEHDAKSQSPSTAPCSRDRRSPRDTTATLPGRSEPPGGIDPSPLLDGNDKSDVPVSSGFKFQDEMQNVSPDAEEREPLRQQELVVPETSMSTSPPPDKGVSFLIIIFFYFQDAQLLHIKTVFASSEQHAKVIFREFLAGLFRFQVEIFQFMGHFCFLADLTPVKKMVINVALVPYILLQFGIVHIIHRWYPSLACFSVFVFPVVYLFYFLYYFIAFFPGGWCGVGVSELVTSTNLTYTSSPVSIGISDICMVYSRRIRQYPRLLKSTLPDHHSVGIGAMSTGNGHDLCWGRYGKFGVGVALLPRLLAMHTGLS